MKKQTIIIVLLLASLFTAHSFDIQSGFTQTIDYDYSLHDTTINFGLGNGFVSQFSRVNNQINSDPQYSKFKHFLNPGLGFTISGGATIIVAMGLVPGFLMLSGLTLDILLLIPSIITTAVYGLPALIIGIIFIGFAIKHYEIYMQSAICSDNVDQTMAVEIGYRFKLY